jgi:hypothetical protein
VGLRTTVEAERGKIVSYVGYLTALTESHSQWASYGIRGYINGRTVGEIRRFKLSLR